MEAVAEHTFPSCCPRIWSPTLNGSRLPHCVRGVPRATDRRCTRLTRHPPSAHWPSARCLRVFPPRSKSSKPTTPIAENHVGRTYANTDHRPGVDSQRTRPRGPCARLPRPGRPCVPSCERSTRLRSGSLMIWLASRQFRMQALTAVVAFVALGAVLAYTGPHVVHLYGTDGIPGLSSQPR